MQNSTSIEDIYKTIRPQIEHINNNLAQRILWMVIAQSFFFSGYAILVTGKPGTDGAGRVYHYLVAVFPIAALLTVVFSYIDIIASLLYLRQLKQQYEKAAGEMGSNGFYPPIMGYEQYAILTNAAPFLLPLIFIIIWITILLV